MRMFGVNLVAVLVAALAMYVIGFVVYGVLFAEPWMSMNGYTQSAFKGHEWRMALGPIMPLVTAFGIALAFKKLDVGDLASGLTLAAVLWFAFSFTTGLYDFAYGIEPAALLALDSAHALATYLAAGAILARWR